MTSWAGDDDQVYRFSIEGLGVHGRLVRLGPAVDALLARLSDKPAVAELLGEFVVSATALGAAMKFDGRFVAQARGEYGSDGAVRGYARTDRPVPEGEHGLALMGKAHMALIVDQGPDTERYEGIVALEGETLGAAMDGYFATSQQINGLVRPVAMRRQTNGAATWRAGCLLIEQTADAAQGDFATTAAERWAVVMAVLPDFDPSALVEPAWDPMVLIDALFPDQGVTIFDPLPVRFACHCSQARAEGVVVALPATARRDMLVGGVYSVLCEFCGAEYRFDDSALVDA